MVQLLSHQDHLPGNAGAVRHLAQGSALVLFVLLLHDQVGINAVFQVKERIHVPEIPAVLPGRAWAVGGWVLRVGGGFQRRAIYCQQTIATKGLPRAQQGCEAVEQRFQRRGQQLLTLLDKGRSRRCFSLF